MPVKLDLPLFWMSHCMTCGPANVDNFSQRDRVMQKANIVPVVDWGPARGYTCPLSEFQKFSCFNFRRSSNHCQNFNTSPVFHCYFISLQVTAVLCWNFSLTGSLSSQKCQSSLVLSRAGDDWQFRLDLSAVSKVFERSAEKWLFAYFTMNRDRRDLIIQVNQIKLRGREYLGYLINCHTGSQINKYSIRNGRYGGLVVRAL